MLIPNHPSDERLSALASADADATADAELGSHVAACARCTEIVTDLGALRASLADLPDLRPSRPLRLLPEVSAEPEPDRLGGWVRRIFAPVLTAGAALAMVGLVGTTAPLVSTGGADGGTGDAGAEMQTAESPESGVGGDTGAGGDGPLASDRIAAPQAENDGEDGEAFGLQSAGVDERGESDRGESAGIPAERSPWPMVLFSGLALVVGAVLLRWIVVPRAG